MKKYALVDIETGRAVAFGSFEMKSGHIIAGGCTRCGNCCSAYEGGNPCRHLKYENVDGVPKAYCSNETLFAGYRGRPVGCAIYPRDDHKILDGCGFHFIKGDGG